MTGTGGGISIKSGYATHTVHVYKMCNVSACISIKENISFTSVNL